MLHSFALVQLHLTGGDSQIPAVGTCGDWYPKSFTGSRRAAPYSPLARFPSSPVTATTRTCARMIVFAFVEICMSQGIEVRLDHLELDNEKHE